MTDEELKKLFEKFGQANKKINAQHRGTGLGLVISKGLVELMGGQITVRSAIGQGTCFSFRILCTTLTADEK